MATLSAEQRIEEWGEPERLYNALLWIVGAWGDRAFPFPPEDVRSEVDRALDATAERS